MKQQFFLVLLYNTKLKAGKCFAYINRLRWSLIVASIFCSQKHAALGLSDIPSKIWTYLLHKQNCYSEKTSGQNNDGKTDKLHND